MKCEVQEKRREKDEGGFYIDISELGTGGDRVSETGRMSGLRNERCMGRWVRESMNEKRCICNSVSTKPLCS